MHFAFRSSLHQQLAEATEVHASLHAQLEVLHGEKAAGLAELEAELRRTEAESAKRRAAESKVRQMEADIASLANANDTVRLFAEAAQAKSRHAEQMAALQRQLAGERRRATEAESALRKAREQQRAPPVGGGSDDASNGLDTGDALGTPGAGSAKKGVRWSVDGSAGAALEDASNASSAAPAGTMTPGRDGGGGSPSNPSGAKSPRESELEKSLDDLKGDVLGIQGALL